MKNLIKFNLKLVLREKSYYLTYLFLAMFFMVLSQVFIKEFTNNILFIQLTLMGAAFSIVSARDYEKNKGSNMEKSILSFPVTRKDYVLSKYIIYILFTLIFCIVNLFIISLFSFFIDKNLEVISTQTIKISIYYNIVIGIFYLFVIVLSRGNIANALVGGIMGFSINYIVNLYENMPNRLININKTLIISLIIYSISFFICYFIFDNRDIN